MDSYREYPSDFEPASETSNAAQVAAVIGTDERRMHVRAYNYWVSLLEGRDFPSIEDLDPENLQDFAANSVLLDFTCGRDNPAIPYIGGAIRDECGLDDDTRTIADVPSRSLLSRLTDHYLQIIANRAPIGFEAEFANQREETICYRGILMPFSSDGDAIDFIYGVINWKTVGEEAEQAPAQDMPVVEPATPDVGDEPGDDVASTDAMEISGIDSGEEHSSWDDAPSHHAEPEAECSAEPEPDVELSAQPEPDVEPSEASSEAAAAAPVHFSWEDGPLADSADDDDADMEAAPRVNLEDDAGLADRLSAARETAAAVKLADGRTRLALYRALSLAYDFAIAAQQNPEDYAELLEESGVKAQARAPMTPIVKLVFGIDYDKARLTEFAAALSYAQRRDIGAGGFQIFIESQPGGLKALVAAERDARRPEPRPDTRGEAARARLRTVAPISLEEVPADEEFAVIVTRRGADGRHEPVAVVDDEGLVERAIRKVA
ncbi:MAG TPA: hypothetical protein VFU87_00750 [Sphingomicrobium sp.]|nr:hypothetical protein [Sphingomicrobium sp.]